MNHGVQEKEEDRREEEALEEVRRVPQDRAQHAHLPRATRSSLAFRMSVFIGNVKGPDHNSPHDAAQVWCSPGAVELIVVGDPDYAAGTIRRSLDPIAARNLAALLVRASEEADRMAARAAFKMPGGWRAESPEDGEPK